MSYLADFLNKHYPEDVESTLKTAEDAVGRRFLFNQRWDMERTYVPVEFKGEIDFLHQPGDDPEWIYAFNRLKHFVSLAQAWTLTGDGRYSSELVSQLRSWIASVRYDDPRCSKAWRTIETGIRLDTFVKTYLLMRDCPEFMDAEALFMESVECHASFILENSWNSYHLMSNWGVLSNHGLYTAGCVFGREDWRTEALRRLSLELENEVYDDGTQWEQSPMYHNEVLRDYLDVILFSKLYGHDLEPWFTEKVHKMALVNLKWVKPDGSEPMMGDSDDIDMRDLLSYSAYVFSDGSLKALGYDELDYETAFIAGETGIEGYRKIKAVLPEKTDYLLEDSGNAAARTGWGRDDSYLRFHCGTLGAGHGHADQTHLSFVLDGHDFIVDAGRYTYVFGEGRKSFKDMHAHNVVIVDGEECYPEKDSWECHSLNKAVNLKASFKGRDIAIEGGHLGYISKGVFVNRKVIWLKDKRFLVVADEFYAEGRHSYSQLWHFAEGLEVDVNGNTAVAGNCRITQLSSSTLSLSVKDSEISRHYNSKYGNKCLETSIEADGNASIITVFDFGEDKGNAKLLEVKSNFKGITFRSDEIEALEFISSERDIVIAIAHKEYATPTDTFLTGGCTGFGQVTVFDRKEGQFQIGKRLIF